MAHAAAAPLQAAARAYIRFMFQAIVTRLHSPWTWVKATQEELAEAHHRFDDTEHRFRNLLAQGNRASCLRASADDGSWPRAASGFSGAGGALAKRSAKDG